MLDENQREHGPHLWLNPASDKAASNFCECFSTERILTKETGIYLKYWNLHKRKELVLASAFQNLQRYMGHQYGFAVLLAQKHELLHYGPPPPCTEVNGARNSEC